MSGVKPHVLEFGMGVDVHGQDSTKAACRAVSDAIRHSSLPFFRDIRERGGRMFVDVTVAVPDPASVDIEQVRRELPHGEVTIRPVPGGLRVPASDTLLACVAILVGPLSTAEAYALLPYIEARKIPTLSPTVAAEDLTQRRRSQYVVRTGWSAGQPAHPFGPWVVEMLKYRKIAIVAQDFAFGHESSAAFQRTFEEAGGQIVQKLFAPLGTADYGPYLARLRRDVDAVYAAAAGADALRFVRQYADAGLKERLPLIGSGNFTDEHVLRNMDDTALGIVTALHYSAALATPANQRFVKAYEARFNQMPSYYSEGPYAAGSALKAALDAVGGEIEDVPKFLAALRKVNITDAPRGPITFDDYGHPIQNIYVRRVERVDGKLQNTVIHTFPKVSQFWTYKPDEYLKNPVYSRDWPPCKAC